MSGVTLEELRRPGVDVRAHCGACGRSVVIPMGELIGGATTVPELRGRFRCERCGSRETAAQPNYVYRGPSP